MTFFEAAVEVLRAAQRPLDYKTITQFAINRQLLGHVGHTPDLVMATCLLRAVQRSDTGAILRIPTGEFALRGWSEEILAKTQDSSIPNPVSDTPFPPQHIGLMDPSESCPILSSNAITFTPQDTQSDSDEIKPWDDDQDTSRFERVKHDLSAQQNEHYNLCAAIVKFLRNEPNPIRSTQIAELISQKSGTTVHEQSVVLAMRADNALRVSRGKRAIFMHIPPNLWTLTENLLTRHILKIESKLYDMSRQMRLYSIHALTIKLRELSTQAWSQLALIILKHLNYTIVSQCKDITDSDSSVLLRAEETRGLTHVPVIIKIIRSQLTETQDILQFRELIKDLGYDHGLIMTNGDISRDALNECTTKTLPIYAYSARQIAPIMLDAKIGVIPNELPVVFIDNNFFQALSEKQITPEEEPPSVEDHEDLSSLLVNTHDEDPFNELFQENEVISGEYILASGIRNSLREV